MSGASDKARHHVEKTVPELREWERRELFTKIQAELASVSSQRTHFETLLASREATPALCLRYFAHERNLTSLLSKRLARKGLAGRTTQKLQVRRQQQLFSILERSTRKFHGHLPLWAQYLDHCKDQGSGKKAQRVITDICRLFPTRPAVWESAAAWAEQRGDVQQARGFWLRGCRFCPRDWALQLAFARAEMRWVERARKTLGVKGQPQKTIDDERDEDKANEDEARDADMIALPPGPDEDADADADADAEQAQDFAHFSSTPAMTGAIPMAIFDSAMQTTDFADDALRAFFDMFAEFPGLPSSPRILDHVLDAAEQRRPASSALASCRCRHPLVGVQLDSPDFPAALRTCLARVRESLAAAEAPKALANRLLGWLRPLAADERLVSELKQVVDATIKRVAKAAG